MPTKVMDRGHMEIEHYIGTEDPAVTTTDTTLVDTRGFTPSGASAYWAGATVYCGNSVAEIGNSDATTLTLNGPWSVGTPDQGLAYTIIRDYGSQYRYANQVYTAYTNDSGIDVQLWAMPTLSLPDSVVGAMAFVKADVVAVSATQAMARWRKESTFKWLTANWQPNAASLVDVAIDRCYKEPSLQFIDCALTLRTADFYPVLYVNDYAIPLVIHWQATIEFSVYSL